MRVVVTGGAGFVGSSVAVGLGRRHPDWQVVALDNLKRRGSELNLPRLREGGVVFVHGDVRSHGDLAPLEPMDALIECSAEPSALTGVDGHTDYAVQANLLGAYHCLELARRAGAQFVFLSTSRVYPVQALNAVRYREGDTRLELLDEQELDGVSSAGISERFPLAGARTLYGATKLAAELLVAEYAETFALRTVINRCGVLAGPWQMGKVDQGVFTYWALHHHFGLPLRYLGFGGTGKQVRDLLHIDDFVELIDQQLDDPDAWSGATVNVGGGRERSLSLLETTEFCRELTGTFTSVEGVDETRPGDVPIYVSDCDLLYRRTSWRPSRSARDILEDIVVWIRDYEDAVSSALGVSVPSPKS
jgi:CDP-paratose 2-epimerase